MTSLPLKSFSFNIYFFSFSRKLLSELITSKMRSKDKDGHKEVNITGSSLWKIGKWWLGTERCKGSCFDSYIFLSVIMPLTQYRSQSEADLQRHSAHCLPGSPKHDLALQWALSNFAASQSCSPFMGCKGSQALQGSASAVGVEHLTVYIVMNCSESMIP